jgi:hypothetical protein
VHLRYRLSRTLLLAACASCGGSSARASPPSSPRPLVGGAPAACEKPWTLGIIGGDGRIVVTCANDVQRQPLDESSALARALAPGLDPTRERVCACASRQRAPSFVDLVFTAKPEEGRVTVSATRDEDVDPDVSAAFAACVGTVNASYEPIHSGACPAGPATAIYPVRLELEP